MVIPLERDFCRAGWRAATTTLDRLPAHDRLGDNASLARAVAAIRAASGVRPRVFRPPLGATSQRLVVAALALGLLTVTWDVDPRDGRSPARPCPDAVALDGILDDLATRRLVASVAALRTPCWRWLASRRR